MNFKQNCEHFFAMYNFPFSQNFSNNFQARSFSFYGVVLILVLTFVIGCLAFKARHDQWKVWKSNKNITFVQESPLLSTTDGPYFLHMARTVDQNQSFISWNEKRFFPESKKEFRKPSREPSFFEVSLLAYSIKSLSKLYNNDYLLASNLLIPISAFLTSVFIFSLFFAVGFSFEGIVAGLGASLSPALLFRTSIGRVDTDLLNVGFFYSILALIAASFRTNNQKFGFVFICLAGFMNFLFNFWYHHPGFFIPFLFIIIILQVLHKVKLKNSIYQIILFSVFSGPYFVIQSLSGFKHFLAVGFYFYDFKGLVMFLSKSVSSNNINTDGVNTDINTLVFPDTFQTVSELNRIDIMELLKLGFGQGNEWLGIVGIVGFLIFIIFNFKSFIVMLPAVAFLIISIFLGRRYMMYAMPLYWFGVAYLCTSLSYVLIGYIKSFKSIESQVKILVSSCICIGLIVLISNISLSSCKNSSFFNCIPKYFPKPAVSAEITQGFLSLQSKNFDQSSIVITWWDYGYWLNYFSGLTSVIDGGTQRSAKTYLVANSLTASSQKKSYDTMNYIVSSTLDKVISDSKNGAAFFENRISQSHPINRPVLLFLTNDMVRWWQPITYLGNWDVVNGRPKDIAEFEKIDCKQKEKSQSEMICKNPNFPRSWVLDTNNGATKIGEKKFFQLDSLVIVKDGSLILNNDYKNKKGETSQITRASMLIDIVGKKRSFYLVKPETLASTFTQLYFFNQPKKHMFKLVKDAYPFYRVFELYK